jgi:hypothetical protein
MPRLILEYTGHAFLVRRALPIWHTPRKIVAFDLAISYAATETALRARGVMGT